jgi:gliding motility-associated-like protein
MQEYLSAGHGFVNFKGRTKLGFFRPMRLQLLTILITLLSFLEGAGQNCPPNIGFESGTFNNWETLTGSVTTAGISLSSGPSVFDRHTLMDRNSGRDEYGDFPRLCPYGGNYSVKLGNDGVMAEAEGLSYSFVVPSNLDTFTMTYFYAVVFEDPGHLPIEQPRFLVTAYDLTTNQSLACSSFDYVASGSIPGFHTAQSRNTVRYKDWTPASLQFAGLSGHTILLEFKTSDCSRGGHFGYAYVDVASTCTNLLATAPFCIASNSLVLNAPYGFQDYIWYNSNFSQVIGTGQSVVLSPPPVTSGSFFVDMIPYPGYGCRDTLQAIVTPLPVPDTPSAPADVFYCVGMIPSPLTATPSPNNVLVWYTSDTARSGSSMAPLPPTSGPGVTTWWVAQKALFGCESNRKPINVHVVGSIPLTFTIDNDTQCLVGNSFRLTNTSPDIGRGYYVWEHGDNTTAASLPGDSVQHTYASAGPYTVTLNLRNAASCSGSVQLPLTVIPKPMPDFSTQGSLCEGAAPLTLSDRSTVSGSTITQWWWDIAGVVSVGQVPPPTAVSLGGFTVRMAVRSAEGCLSDTLVRAVPVYHNPIADFTVSTRCDNEPGYVRDASHMPAGVSGERVSGWNWNLDGQPFATGQSPVLMLPAGMHRLQLVAESDKGCRSPVADSPIVVLSKPAINFTRDDSCAHRDIHFTALDLSGDVTQWRWNSGAGYATGGAVHSRNYTGRGNFTVALIGANVAGCRDTIIRSMRIYDVSAVAGRDTIAAIGEPLQLQAGGGPGLTYNWSPPDGLNATNIADPVSIDDRDRRYNLVASDTLGCVRQSSILVRRIAGPELYVPNAFTPNGDGRNDLLRVIAVGIRDFHYLAIYDRWGGLVFRSTDRAQGWDGNLKGQASGSGTYVWIAEGTDYTGRKLLRKGTVTIVR